jgi:hypothetical protein
MIQRLLRFAKRFAVLVPGIIIAYLSVHDILPVFDKRLPFSLAILATYALAAYVLMPALVRLYRIFRPADHLPLYCVTPDGFASDPLNIGIIATRRELILAMEQAGWLLADQRNLRNSLRYIVCVALEQPYPTAPMSNLYLFGRKQDIGFERPTGTSPSERHHVRFWATTFEQKDRLSIHSINWQHRREHVYGDELLWVGAASLDVGLGFIRHNLQITHMIAPDTNRERTFIISRLRDHKLVKKTETIKLGNAYRVTNRVMRGFLHTDGKMTIVRLKKR